MSHHRMGGGIVNVGMAQYALHRAYARRENAILRLIDKVLAIGVLRLGGGIVLKALARLLGFLPTGEVVSLARALAFLRAISRLEPAEIAVGPCRCQEALGRRCGSYEKDIVVLYGERIYAEDLQGYRRITAAQAEALVAHLHREGLMLTFYACMQSRRWLFALCACDSEICVPFRAHAASGSVLAPGPDIVRFDQNRCIACGSCRDRCPFGANGIGGPEPRPGAFDPTRCYGCGLCVQGCGGEARTLVLRSPYRNRYYPLRLARRALAS